MKALIVKLIMVVSITLCAQSMTAQKVFEFEEYNLIMQDDISSTVVGDLRGKDIEVKKIKRGLTLHNQHKENVRIKILEGKTVVQEQWVSRGDFYKLDCSALDYGLYNVVIIAESGGIIKKLEIKKEKA
ncbi:MAG: hypothetical protein MRY83_12320 [Flavobacteriales bacterium]|nr:hypothetical protein [Flavobacteriales bacterium]